MIPSPGNTSDPNDVIQAPPAQEENQSLRNADDDEQSVDQALSESTVENTSTIITSSEGESSSVSFLDDDDVMSVASSVYSTIHSHGRKEDRSISNEEILQAKKHGLYELQPLNKRWKVTFYDLVVILEHDKKTLITTYRTQNAQAICFYNMICKRIEESNLSLEEFKTLIQKRSSIILGLDFSEWPPKKPLVLHVTIYGRLDLLKYLLEECGYKAEVVGKSCFNLLHYACHYGHYEIIEYVLNELGTVGMLLSQEKNEYGETPVDALKVSDKIKSEELRNKCLSLFEQKRELLEKPNEEEHPGVMTRELELKLENSNLEDGNVNEGNELTVQESEVEEIVVNVDPSTELTLLQNVSKEGQEKVEQVESPGNDDDKHE